MKLSGSQAFIAFIVAFIAFIVAQVLALWTLTYITIQHSRALRHQQERIDKLENYFVEMNDVSLREQHYLHTTIRLLSTSHALRGLGFTNDSGLPVNPFPDVSYTNLLEQ